VFETPLHWVDGIAPARLALSARPRGGEALADEMAAWRRAGVDVVVSLLQADEARRLELRDESAACRAAGMAFRSLPIVDHGLPASAKEVDAFVAELADVLRQGHAVAIHCFAGIGRTGMVAACVLHRLGVPAPELFHRLSRARGISMPDTAAQADWVERFVERPPS